MTGPSAGSDRKSLRASDQDREHAAEVLRDAAGEGRLSLRASSMSGWTPCTRPRPTPTSSRSSGDLPHTGPVPPPAPTVTSADSAAVNRFGGEPTSSAAIAIMGGFSRKGAWVVPAKFTAVAIMAGGELDLREARFAERVVRIHATAIMGGIAIIVPDDAEVHVTGVGLMGAFEHGPTGTGQPGAPKILISGLAFWGAVDVQAEAAGGRNQAPEAREQAPETGVEETARAITGPPGRDPGGAAQAVPVRPGVPAHRLRSRPSRCGESSGGGWMHNLCGAGQERGTRVRC